MGLRICLLPLWLGFWLVAASLAQEPAAEAQPDLPEMLGQKRIIGAIALVEEHESGIEFNARVDTGAKSCSLHVERILIESESEDVAENLGKAIRFRVKNRAGDSAWVESKIVGRVLIKNAHGKERRYKVRLTLRWKDLEKRVLVTLNDRADMEFPLLLGRNWLQDDFLVDVSLDNDEKHSK